MDFVEDGLIMKPPTRAPFYACMYHGLCDTARKHGYALAIHGTVTTDLDLIAIPWVEDAADPVTLKDALMAHISACDYEGLTRQQFPNNEDLVTQILANEKKRKADAGEYYDETGAQIKPHGRRAWNLYLDHGAKVDLSVMPRAPVSAGESPAQPIPASPPSSPESSPQYQPLPASAPIHSAPTA